jgi:hypothetical protein
MRVRLLARGLPEDGTAAPAGAWQGPRGRGGRGPRRPTGGGHCGTGILIDDVIQQDDLLAQLHDITGLEDDGSGKPLTVDECAIRRTQVLDNVLAPLEGQKAGARPPHH